jgi:hypothetical protein
LRFILSNLKGKKVNPTSLSSLHALALVMEQVQVGGAAPNHQNHQQQQPPPQQQPFLESAGRALWGCICEARKVVDACALEHEKTNHRLAALEQEVEALKEEITTTAKTRAESEDIAKAVAVAAVIDDDEDGDDPLDDLAAAIADDFLDSADTEPKHHRHNHTQAGGEDDDEDDPIASATAILRDKTRTLLSGRASSERKWRDSQLAFASILKVS